MERLIRQESPQGLRPLPLPPVQHDVEERQKQQRRQECGAPERRQDQGVRAEYDRPVNQQPSPGGLLPDQRARLKGEIGQQVARHQESEQVQP